MDRNHKEKRHLSNTTCNKEQHIYHESKQRKTHHLNTNYSHVAIATLTPGLNIPYVNDSTPVSVKVSSPMKPYSRSLYAQDTLPVYNVHISNAKEDKIENAIIISNFPDDMLTEQNIVTFFCIFGAILYIDIYKPPKVVTNAHNLYSYPIQALICFTSPSSALHAQKYIDHFRASLRSPSLHVVLLQSLFNINSKQHLAETKLALGIPKSIKSVFPPVTSLPIPPVVPSPFIEMLLPVFHHSISRLSIINIVNTSTPPISAPQASFIALVSSIHRKNKLLSGLLSIRTQIRLEWQKFISDMVLKYSQLYMAAIKDENISAQQLCRIGNIQQYNLPQRDNQHNLPPFNQDLYRLMTEQQQQHQHQHQHPQQHDRVKINNRIHNEKDSDENNNKNKKNGVNLSSQFFTASYDIDIEYTKYENNRYREFIQTATPLRQEIQYIITLLSNMHLEKSTKKISQTPVTAMTTDFEDTILNKNLNIKDSSSSDLKSHAHIQSDHLNVLFSDKIFPNILNNFDMSTVQTENITTSTNTHIKTDTNNTNANTKDTNTNANPNISRDTNTQIQENNANIQILHAGLFQLEVSPEIIPVSLITEQRDVLANLALSPPHNMDKSTVSQEMKNEPIKTTKSYSDTLLAGQRIQLQPLSKYMIPTSSSTLISSKLHTASLSICNIGSVVELVESLKIPQFPPTTSTSVRQLDYNEFDSNSTSNSNSDSKSDSLKSNSLDSFSMDDLFQEYSYVKEEDLEATCVELSTILHPFLTEFCYFLKYFLSIPLIPGAIVWCQKRDNLPINTLDTPNTSLNMSTTSNTPNTNTPNTSNLDIFQILIQRSRDFAGFFQFIKLQHRQKRTSNVENNGEEKRKSEKEKKNSEKQEQCIKKSKFQDLLATYCYWCIHPKYSEYSGEYANRGNNQRTAKGVEYPRLHPNCTCTLASDSSPANTSSFEREGMATVMSSSSSSSLYQAHVELMDMSIPISNYYHAIFETLEYLETEDIALFGQNLSHTSGDFEQPTTCQWKFGVSSLTQFRNNDTQPLRTVSNTGTNAGIDTNADKRQIHNENMTLSLSTQPSTSTSTSTYNLSSIPIQICFENVHIVNVQLLQLLLDEFWIGGKFIVPISSSN